MDSGEQGWIRSASLPNISGVLVGLAEVIESASRQGEGTVALADAIRLQGVATTLRLISCRVDSIHREL